MVPPLTSQRSTCSVLPAHAGMVPERREPRRARYLLPAHAGMVHWRPVRSRPPPPAPRARGDGPLSPRMMTSVPPCSPRTRGWSVHAVIVQDGGRLLPVHAGMVLPWVRGPQRIKAAPRARGDGPRYGASCNGFSICSPRTRGWSPPSDAEKGPLNLLPAHAGMVQTRTPGSPLWTSAPRARGDGPTGRADSMTPENCSPRTRGWSVDSDVKALLKDLLPAHAGMVPRSVTAVAPGSDCSPRTRGWSQRAGPPCHQRGLLPAHAGMVLMQEIERSPGHPAPRARGDGPTPRIAATTRYACSPHTRGWSGHRNHHPVDRTVLPAHAGMVPRTKARTSRLTRAPCARGDGPDAFNETRDRILCSPRTRGWSGDAPRDRLRVGVLPAHAGMVPLGFVVRARWRVAPAHVGAPGCH